MIYVFLAEGFEEIEALTPIDCLRRAGKQVITVGVGGKIIAGAHGIQVVADITDLELELNDALEMVVLPGGMPGTRNLGNSDIVRRAILYANDSGKWVTAICAAPTILGKMNLLSGKQAVCYPGCEGELAGAKIGTEAVCVDGKIVTGKGPGAALEFGLMLVECLLGTDTRNTLAANMVCKR